MTDRPALFDELQTLTTETRNPRTLTIDTAPLPEVVQMLHEEDQRAVDAVTSELPYVVQAVEIIEHAFRKLRAGVRDDGCFDFGPGMLPVEEIHQVYVVHGQQDG